MKGKFGLIVGLGVGYVLGARDGRQRYDKIKAQAQQLWRRPEVQDAVEAAGDLASQAVDQATAAGEKLARGKRPDQPVPPDRPVR
ncbi:YtxH domain-containing protein [Occultella aeris]|uniref:YtxH domain-containing protein n=1 Tax=Occultella aeris TaxID=2761496 RepID=A0A7M4DG64_9MICO|nr:YtxH domain-containing protein [Occultella aeris]VZO35907.1 hypothetical protein HALOF300_01110 [Occultella aeris]